MSQHSFEVAPSGRSKCRGCGLAIAKGEVRFGERLPNPFGDGDMVHWHHPKCACLRRPEPFLQACGGATVTQLEVGQHDINKLKLLAEQQQQHRRLCRLGTAQQASSGRARCRHCKELIAKDHWRLPLIFFEEGTYASAGFIHVQCASDYCEGADVWPVIEHFAGLLTTAERSALKVLVSAD